MRFGRRLWCWSIGVVVLCLVGLVGSVVFAGLEWVSPDSHTDNDWVDEGNAYDENTSTFALHSMGMMEGWTPYLELFLDETVNSDKCRMWWRSSLGIGNAMLIDVYVAESWENIYDGVWPALGEWVEFEYGEEFEVDGFRVSVYYSGLLGTTCIYEVDIWQVEDEVLPHSVVLSPECDYNEVGENHTFVGIVYDEFDDVMEGVDVSWSLSGVGWIVGSENVTDGSGEVECVISSNVTGNSTVELCVDGYDVCDDGLKVWYDYGYWDVGGEQSLPIWFVGLVLGIVLVGVYTGSGLLLLGGLTGATVGVFWLLSFDLGVASVYLLIALFFCVGAFCLLTFIEKGELFHA